MNKIVLLLIALLVFSVGCTTETKVEEMSKDTNQPVVEEIVIEDEAIEEEIVMEENEETQEEMKNDEPVAEMVEHNIDMEIFQFGYNPELIEVTQGDVINLTLTAIDEGHGFRISEYGINTQLDAGETKTITIRADKVGTFEFDCSVFCGTGHKSMSGQLVVK